MTDPTVQTRRMMLKTVAVTALAAVPACAESAAEPSPALGQPTSDPWRGLKAGMATYSLRKLSLDDCIRGIQRVDLHYCSIKDVHLPLTSTTEQRKETSSKFRDAGITPLSCGNITLKNDEASCRNAFEYARDIGVPTIVCAPDPEALPLLDKLVKEYDIKLAIHNHGPEAAHFKSPDDVWPAIQALDPRIGLCIDVGHTARAGTDPVQAIRNYKARLYDMHFKDVASVHGKNAGIEVEVGRGRLDISGMLKAALEIGYTGHLGFEHEKDAANPMPGVAESLGYTKGVLREMK